MTFQPGAHPQPADRSAHAEPAAPAPADAWAPRLARILDRQRELYESLASLSEQQSRCIESDSTDELLAVLDARQRIITQITAANEEITPFVQDWTALSAALTEPQRLQLRSRFDDVARLVTAIAARDEDDRKRLEERRSAVGREIVGLSRGREALGAYGRPGAPLDARFQDRRA
ncbi:MAG: flagellar export chaperone FlgN [Planctomycetota bacterium]|nr:flagellar export chaperone FlgN [Planctomycetota bacterium]